LFPLFATGVNDTGGKFAAGVVDTVVDTGGKVSLTQVANLPPVSTTQGELVANLVHLDLRIFPRIFEKIRNDSNVIIRGLGENDS
jgi:hypothetical protein